MKNHPATVCESSSLAFVSSPILKYKLALDRSALEVLSNLQIETIMLACQKHKEILPGGERAGFYIGKRRSHIVSD
jgi:hypothetical protein